MSAVDLAEAERALREWVAHPVMFGQQVAARVVLGELDRLRAIETEAAAYVLASECAPEYASGAYGRLRAALGGAS